MHLYLLRHGDALSDVDDPARPLSPRGREEITRVARQLRGRIAPLRILHSGKARALQSAELLREHACPGVALAEQHGLAPNDDVTVFTEVLDSADGDLAVVGHLPYLGRLASLLLCAHSERLGCALVTGACASLQRRDSQWLLEWLVTPALLSPPDK